MAPDLICSICLIDIKDLSPGAEENLLCELTCGHIFHANCVLEGWLKKQK